MDWIFFYDFCVKCFIVKFTIYLINIIEDLFSHYSRKLNNCSILLVMDNFPFSISNIFIIIKYISNCS